MTALLKPFTPLTLRKLANNLTLARAISGLPIVIALSLEQKAIACILILASGITDLLDGWIAKAAGGGTKWGAQLDPLADKIFLAGPLIWIASNKLIPIWAIWLLFSRELIITGWRIDEPRGGPAAFAGKVKTTLQIISIELLLWPSSWGGLEISNELNQLGWWLFWPSLALALFSAKTYIKSLSMPHQN